MTKFSDSNIDHTINNVLKNSSIINWHIPKKRHKYAEIQCLKAGKKVKFDGKETLLSKTMPRRPDAYSEWFKNINTQHPKVPNRDKQIELNKKRVVQEVVGDDPKKLMALWEDIRKHPGQPEEGVPTQEELFKLFSKEQMKALQVGQLAKITGSLVKMQTLRTAAPPPNDLTAQIDRNKEQIKNEIKPYAELLYAENPDINIASLDKLPQGTDDDTKKELKDQLYELREKEQVEKIAELAKVAQITDKSKENVKKACEKYADTLMKHYPGADNLNKRQEAYTNINPPLGKEQKTIIDTNIQPQVDQELRDVQPH